MTEDIRTAAIALYDRFTHDGMDRRAFMADLTRIAGSTAGATALLMSIAANPAAAQIVPAEDKRLRTRSFSWRAAGTSMKGYVAEPAKPARKLGSVIVIHENRGLNAHTEDVARRAALAGYRALAPDFLSISGGTPPGDEDAARTAIGKLDLTQSAREAVATIAMLKALPRSNGKVGMVGFCWGGGMVNRVAVAAGDALSAGVSFYGPAPAPELAAQVRAPLMLQLAELDQRVNATALPWAEALRTAGKPVESMVHPKVNHAFHNDASAERYDRAAAERAWDATLRFFRRHLAAS